MYAGFSAIFVAIPSILADISAIRDIIQSISLILTGFYLKNGIIYGSARIFGGKGTFSVQTYLDSLFFAPLGLISALMTFAIFIPEIGSTFFFIGILVVAIFQIVLTIRSLKVVHSLTMGRAAAAVLVPLMLLLIPICLIVVWFDSIMGHHIMK